MLRHDFFQHFFSFFFFFFRSNYCFYLIRFLFGTLFKYPPNRIVVCTFIERILLHLHGFFFFLPRMILV